jgi:Flp pilus assembly protein protease CpaA
VLLFVFAGGGAGDAKMMAALAAWLGLEAGVVVLVCVAATGAFFGVAHAAMNKQLCAALARVGTSFYVMMVALCCGRRGWSPVKADSRRTGRVGDEQLTMPYGPAIFIGVCIGAFVVRL